MSERCKRMVTAPGGWHSFPCERKATKGEYCWQHDPEYVAKQRKKQEEKWERERQNSLPYRYERLKEENEKMKAQLDAVKEMVGIDARCNCLSDDDTLTEPCGKCLACAIRKALGGDDDQ